MRLKHSAHRAKPILPRTVITIAGALIIIATLGAASNHPSGKKSDRPHIFPVPYVHIEINPDLVEAAKIDRYLAGKGSPMAGTGSIWMAYSEQYGIPVSLALGICGWESQFGRICFRPFNGGGIHGCSFACWQDYIEEQYAFLSRHFGHPARPEDCPGYCEGTPASWVGGVGSIQREVDNNPGVLVQ